MDGTAALLVEVDQAKTSRDAVGHRPPGRMILVGFLLAGMAFVSVTLVGAFRMRAVSIDSADIDVNVFPRVVAVATLRERVRELMTNLSYAVESSDGAMAGFDPLVLQIGQQEAAFEARLAPEQHEDWLRAEAHIAAAVEGIQNIRDLLRARDSDQARSLLDSEVRVAAASADRELWRLQDDTASDGVQSARRIERIRRSTTALSFGLDAFCLAITAIFAGVTVRAVRRHARLIEARSHELEQFAGRVAHDLRSPLSPVLHALQMTSRATPAGDPGRAVVDRAIRCMGRVTTLIDDLLGFARTGGRIDPSARANVLDVTRAAVDDARAQAESQSIDLRIEPHLTDAVVACPSGVLTSLVSNLVRNAIKYMGPARERRIVVRIARLGGDVRIDVSDTGPGLLAGDVDRIFEPYVRADRSGQPGLGLGLATVKRFADAYGGRVGVRSGPTGCTFWFELPLAADPS